MKKETKKFLIGSGAVVAGIAVAGAAVVGATKYLVRIALDREAPTSVQKAKVKLAGSEEHKVLLDKLEEAAQKLENTETETVEITARDGEKLVGHWQTCENPERIIVAMHGWRSSWTKDFGAVADSWHENNCNVLYAEQRGQNDSGGEYMGFGLLERYDCLDWVNWVNEQGLNKHGDKELPIYLCGVSMGATTVLMAAGLELPDNVCGILADCGFTSPHEIWKHVAENNLHVSYNLCGNIANMLCRQKLHVGAKDYSTIDAMKECKVPVLFIHGTEDSFVPVEMTYENFKACAAPKRLFVVPGAGHGMSFFLDQEGYEAAVVQFWNDYNLNTGK